MAYADNEKSFYAALTHSNGDDFTLPAASATDFRPGTGSFTFVTYINANSLPSDMRVIAGKWDPSGGEREWALYTAGSYVIFDISDDGSYNSGHYSECKISASAGDLYLVCRYTYVGDGSSLMELWKGDVTDALTNANGPVYQGGADFIIGDDMHTGEDRHFDGKVYYWAYYNTALTDEQIENIRTGATHPYDLSPVAYEDYSAPWSSTITTKIGNYTFDVNGTPSQGGSESTVSRIGHIFGVTPDISRSGLVAEYLWGNDGNPAYKSGGRHTGINFEDFSTSHYVKLDDTVFDGLDDFSISFWLKSGGAGEQAVLSCANSGEDNELLFFIDSDTVLQLWTAGNDTEYTSLPDLCDDTWKHIVWIRDTVSNKEYVYLNNSLIVDGTPGSTATLNVDTNGAYLGQEQDSLGGGFVAAQALDGILDQFRVYSRVLSESEVCQLYHYNEQNIPSSGLVLEHMADVDDFISSDHLTLYDSSGNEADATLSGVAPCFRNSGQSPSNSEGISFDSTASQTGPVINSTGFYNRPAAVFDGSDWIETYPYQGTDFAGTSFSFAAWIKTTDGEACTIIGCNSSSYANRFIMGLNDSGKLRLYDGSTSYYTTRSGLNDDEWHFLCVTLNDSTNAIKFYIDGEYQSGDDASTTQRFASGDRIAIGQERDGSTPTDFFSGQMGHLRLYNTVLSAEDITALYADILEETTSAIGYEFNVTISSTEATDAQGYLFTIQLDTTSSIGHYFSVEQDAEDTQGHKFEVNQQSTDELGHSFVVVFNTEDIQGYLFTIKVKENSTQGYKFIVRKYATDAQGYKFTVPLNLKRRIAGKINSADKELLSQHLTAEREKPETISRPRETKKEEPDKEVSPKERIDESKKKYENWIKAAEQMKVILADKLQNRKVKVDPAKDPSIRDAIRRVFGVDSDTITYEMFQKALEIRSDIISQERSKKYGTDNAGNTDGSTSGSGS